MSLMLNVALVEGWQRFDVETDVDREFILSALRRYENRLVAKGTGSTFEAISRNDIEQLSIPLPRLDEQRRISGVLRRQMAAVEKARAASQAKLEAAKALPAAIAREAVQNGRTNRRLLGDCLIEVRNGVGKDWLRILGAGSYSRGACSCQGTCWQDAGAI